MTFVGLLAYIWLQTILSQKLQGILYSTKRIFIFRLVFCSISTLNLLFSNYILLNHQKTPLLVIGVNRFLLRNKTFGKTL